MEDVLQVPVSRGYLTKLCTGAIVAYVDEQSSETGQYDLSADVVEMFPS